MAIREKNPHAMALGKMGGSKGGKTRAARLTPEERSASARAAALARWAKVKKTKERGQLGDDIESNLIALCTGCHQRAHRR